MKIYMSAFAILIMSTVSMSSYSEQSEYNEPTRNEITSGEKQQSFKNLDDRFSYAYGVDLAEKFKAEGIELNVVILADAMQNVFGGGERKMTAGEVTATMEIYQQIYAKKKEEEWAAAAEKNKKEGERFLTENSSKEGVVVTESGLQYKIITKGHDGYKPTQNDEVTVHYRGTLVDGTEFDSTHKRNEAYSVKVKQLIPGWSEALQMMSEGSIWELYIPAEIAYGERGSGRYVGPNSVLIFEVALLDIQKEGK